jgi:hypothetical protein
MYCTVQYRWSTPTVLTHCTVLLSTPEHIDKIYIDSYRMRSMVIFSKKETKRTTKPDKLDLSTLFDFEKKSKNLTLMTEILRCFRIFSPSKSNHKWRGAPSNRRKPSNEKTPFIIVCQDQIPKQKRQIHRAIPPPASFLQCCISQQHPPTT